MYTTQIGGAFVNQSGNLQDFDINTEFNKAKDAATEYGEGAASNLFNKAKDAATDFFSPSTAPATPPTVPPMVQQPALPPLSRTSPTLPPQSAVERNRGLIAKVPSTALGAGAGAGAYYLSGSWVLGVGTGIVTTLVLNRMNKRDKQ